MGSIREVRLQFLFMPSTNYLASLPILSSFSVSEGVPTFILLEMLPSFYAWFFFFTPSNLLSFTPASPFLLAPCNQHKSIFKLSKLKTNWANKQKNPLLTAPSFSATAFFLFHPLSHLPFTPPLLANQLPFPSLYTTSFVKVISNLSVALANGHLIVFNLTSPFSNVWYSWPLSLSWI